MKCRCHLQAVVNYASGVAQANHQHIHHFIYKSGKQVGGPSHEETTPKGQVAEIYRYECSYITCDVRLSLQITSPLLNENYVRLLTDPDVLQKRANEAMAAHADRMEGMAAPDPLTVLMTLRAYLSNALRDGQQSKTISAVNKRFMNSFGNEGQPCRNLLEFLGFSAKVCCIIR